MTTRELKINAGRSYSSAFDLVTASDEYDDRNTLLLELKSSKTSACVNMWRRSLYRETWKSSEKYCYDNWWIVCATALYRVFVLGDRKMLPSCHLVGDGSLAISLTISLIEYTTKLKEALQGTSRESFRRKVNGQHWRCDIRKIAPSDAISNWLGQSD